MPAEKIAFGGWPNCVRLANGEAEVIVTTDVGPRVLSYRRDGGDNVLWVDAADAGKSGEKDFRVRGGHRFWTSPEDARSYAPDNSPVAVRKHEALCVTVENPATAPWQIRKTLTICLAEKGASVMLDHRLTNETAAPVTIASWALTVMTPGGFEIIPQPPFREHGKGGFLAERLVVPWSYTDFSDPRWKFSRKFWLLVPEPGTGATKFGFAHLPRWVAWTRKDALFLKTFEYEPGAVYPDFGCNYETFTQGDFLELESLGELRVLAPGESTGHTETWHLFAGVTPPPGLDDAALEKWLAPFLAQTGIA